MDLSSEYIKMCGKAIEIQRLWMPKAGDYFYIWAADIWQDGVNLVYTEGSPMNQDEDNKPIPMGYYCEPEDYFKSAIWLPRQDQLQEMIFSADKRIRTEYCLLQDPESDNNYDLYHYSLVFSGDSIEQCWLKVVMKEKYNKTWNGEDWI